MKKIILIALLFLVLSFLLISVLASEDDSWKEKLGSDLRKKIDEKRFSILKSDEEKIKVIIFTDDKKSIKKFAEAEEVTIIPAVATELPLSAIEKIAKLPATKKILINHPIRALRIEGIPLIRADSASSNFLVNGTGVNISVIDTGIFNHTEFQGPNRIIKQKCYCEGAVGPTGCCPNGLEEDDNATDDEGHGTHCAGIAAGKGNGYGKGVATNASLFAVKVLDSTGSGTDWDVVKGIDWSVQNGAKIISLSLGVAYDNFINCYDVAPSSAVDNATRNGVLVVVAAGNCGPQGSINCPIQGEKTIAAPACAKTAISVGAVDDADHIAGFSSLGPTFDNRTKPDVVAPGVNILSTFGNGTHWGWAEASGTSQATPFVSGVAALLLEKYNKTFGYFPEPGRVKAILLTAVNTTGMQQAGYTQRNNVYGAGRIDAYEALRIMNYTKNDTISQAEQKFYLINTINTSLKVTLVWMENSTVNNNLDLIVGNATHNFTYPTDANDTVEQVFLYNVTPGIWRVYVNGTSVSGQQEFFLAADILPDTIPPKYSNISFNQTAERGEEINISVYWTDESSLSHAFLSTNETGEWKNYTTISLIGPFAWSNFTWVNASLANGTIVLWKVYANDTLGNENVTQIFNFTVIDTKGPRYLNLTNTTDTTYAFNKTYQFNITLQDYSNVSTVIFEWNASSNITVTTYKTINSITREYYTNKIDLAVGNYTYRWFANDTLNWWNVTPLQVYNITKATPNLSLIISPTNSTVYPTHTLANGSVVAGDAGANISLYRDGSLVNSSISSFTFENTTLGAGMYNYTLTYNGTQNYTFVAVTNMTIIAPGSTSVSLWLNDTQSNRTYDRGTIVNITARVNVSSLNVTIAANYTGTIVDIINSTYTATNLTNTSNLAIGIYNLTAYYSGYNSNYSSSSKTYFLTVREAYRNSSINITNNTLTLIDTGKLNITFQILTNDDVVEDSLNVTVGKDNPIGTYPQAITINKYISVEAGINLTTNLTYAIINVSYLDSEIPETLDKNSLRLYRWNSSDWVKFDEPQGGVEIIANYVWANSTTFSNFAIAGLLANGQSCTSNSNCSSNSCCHNICRPSCPYCGDGYCDLGETYSNCPVDCPAPSSGYVAPTAAPTQAVTVKTSDTQANITIPSITSGKITNITISKTFFIRNLSLKTNVTLSNVEITIEKTSKPTGIISPKGIAYEFFEIKEKNIDDSKIDFVKLRFAVNKSWIDVNEINESTVALNRYKDGWEKLDTSKISEDTNQIVYEATSKGLSLFAITGEILEEKICPVCPEPGNWSPCVNNTQTRTAYKCDASTDYICVAYQQTQACEVEKLEKVGRINWSVVFRAIIIFCLIFFVWSSIRFNLSEQGHHPSSTKR